MVADEGFEVGFHGEYREVIPNERLVYTEVFEGAPQAPALVTMTLTEKNGRTTVGPAGRSGASGGDGEVARVTGMELRAVG